MEARLGAYAATEGEVDPERCIPHVEPVRDRLVRLQQIPNEGNDRVEDRFGAGESDGPDDFVEGREARLGGFKEASAIEYTWRGAGEFP